MHVHWGRNSKMLLFISTEKLSIQGEVVTECAPARQDRETITGHGATREFVRYNLTSEQKFLN